ncbi:MAG: Rieske 2Fe-2S protein [Chloroflexi bacterium]|nr:Rieske 2Fe-2S protein [Chloroflexota bacterium]
MLTQEANDRLTRVGPGTPMGELLRRYWQPVALIEELPAGGAPLPVRLMGEDLVLFRDDQGRPGLLGLHCAHRGADLSYGRIEDGGLRCIYHGWLYDVNGRCVEQPGEPAGSTFHERIRHRAYPCREAGGMVLAYLGPGEPPLLPAYPFLTASDTHRYNSKILHACNFLQANEGNYDPCHTPFLHRYNEPGPHATTYIAAHNVPSLDVELTDYGLRIYQLRKLDADKTYVRLTNFVLPNLCAFSAGGNDGYTCNWHVPIDDTHHWKFVIQFRQERPMDLTEVAGERNAVRADYRIERSRANRYLQDREEMKERSFAGLGRAFQAQDMCATEGEGPIQDRTQEHLGRTDVAVAAGRTLLLAAMDAVEAGDDPLHVLRAPNRPEVPTLIARGDMLPDADDWRHYWERIPATTRLADSTVRSQPPS